jgi:hypothetical protein
MMEGIEIKSGLAKFCYRNHRKTWTFGTAKGDTGGTLALGCVDLISQKQCGTQAALSSTEMLLSQDLRDGVTFVTILKGDLGNQF